VQIAFLRTYSITSIPEKDGGDPVKRARSLGGDDGRERNEPSDGLSSDVDGNAPDPRKRSKIDGEPAQALPPQQVLPKTVVLCNKDGDLVDLNETDSEDSLVQVLRYILTKPMFKDLLTEVAAEAAKVSDVQTLVQEQGDLDLSTEDLNELLAITKGLDAGAAVVVIDRRDDPNRGADYNPDTNVITIGGHSEVESQEDTEDYWSCMYRLLFELCNAAGAGTHRTIMAEAHKGKLGCVSFVISLELSEHRSYVKRDHIWSMLAAGPHQVRKRGQTVTSNVPALPTINMNTLRPDVAMAATWQAQLNGGHVATYVKMWFGNFAMAFKANSPKDWQKLLQVISPQPADSDSDSESLSDSSSASDSDSDSEENDTKDADKKQLLDEVEGLVGIRPQDIQILDVEDQMCTYYEEQKQKQKS
jgi:hypothetical protein